MQDRFNPNQDVRKIKVTFSKEELQRMFGNIPSEGDIFLQELKKVLENIKG